MADENLSVLLSLTDELTGPLKNVGSALDDLNSKVVALAGSFLGIEGAARAFSEAVDAADKLQDTSRALQTFTGSATAAAAAMDTFEAAQTRTRSTAIELANLYTQVLPLGIRQGWSQDVLAQITVGLDQLAAKAGAAPQAMIAAFDQLVAGRVNARNPLLQILGLTPDDINQATDAGQTLFDAIMAKAGEVPDSFASMVAKIKDTLSTALGTGFMSEFGQGSDAMTKFAATFKDPDFLSALEQIGKAFAQILQSMQAAPEAAAGWLMAVSGITGFVGQGLGAGSGTALSPGYQAAMDANIAAIRARRGLTTGGPGTLYNQQMGIAPDDTSGPGFGNAFGDSIFSTVGQAGKTATDAVNIITKLHDSITQVMTDYHAWIAAGGSDAGFGEQQAANLDKINMELATLGEQADTATQNVLNLGGAWTKLPQGQSLTQFMQSPDFQAAQSDMHIMTPFGPATMGSDGNYTIDDSAVLADSQKVANFQVDLNTKNAALLYTEQAAQQKALADAWRTDFIEPLSDAFADLGSTGGQNIAKIFGAALAKEMQQAGAGLIQTLQNGLGSIGIGGRTFYSAGQIGPNGQPLSQQDATALNMAPGGGGVPQGYGQAAVGIAGFALNSAAMSPLQGAISGFSIGSSLGTGIAGGLSADALASVGGAAGASLAGGLIGAFVGAVIIAIGQATPTIQTYAVPAIKDGVAQLYDVIGSQMLSPSEQLGLLDKIQTSFDTFRNGYIQIFLGLPTAIQSQVLPQVAAIVKQMMTGSLAGTSTGLPGGDGSNGPLLGDGTPGNPYRNNPNWNPQGNSNSLSLSNGQTPGSLAFPGPYGNNSQTNSSQLSFATPAQVQQWWQEWISNQLPMGVMEDFKPAFQSTFDAMGVTVDKFNQIWKQAETMDPQDALTYLGGYLTALGTLQQLMGQLKTPVMSTGGLWNTTSTTMNQSFVASLATGAQDIANMATGISLLTGQSQIDQINKINTALTNRYQLEQQYIQQLIQSIQTAKDQLSGNLLTLQLAGKTPQQQYSILQGQLGTLEHGLGNETTAAQTTADYNQIVQIVMQMAQMFPNNPAIQAWAQAELTKDFGVYQTSLQAFGAAIDASNTALTTQLQPVITLLTSDTTQFGVDLTTTSTSVSALDTAASAAATSVTNFGAALDSVTASLAKAGYVGSVKRSRINA